MSFLRHGLAVFRILHGPAGGGDRVAQFGVGRDFETVVENRLTDRRAVTEAPVSADDDRQVDEAALIDVMKNRPDLTALLDVTYPEPAEAGSELYTTPNIFLTPHMAGSMNDEVHRMADYMIEEFTRFANGEDLKYQVSEKMLLTSKK